MASSTYLLILVSFSCLCCVDCVLHLSEGLPCVTNGFNGTCVEIAKCVSAALTYLYANAGFDPVRYKFPELPDICSIKNNTFLVCCTDCGFEKITDRARDIAVGPMADLRVINDRVAETKCLENFQRLPYPCRGVGEIEIRKSWNEERKCHFNGYSMPFSVEEPQAQKREFPHSALIGYGDDVESALWLCGGSVISERFILTAAHCASVGNITFAALGLLKRTDPKKYWKIYKIKRIIMHPEYKSPSKFHDIALLETETEINFGRDLLPACLDTLQGSKVTAEAAVWRRLGPGNALADTLQVVDLHEYNETECARVYPPHKNFKNGYDHEKQMCYGNANEIVNTCEGDIGGPLLTNEFKCLYTIVGVTSYGKDCGVLGSPGMYTRVSYYVRWIESIVWPEETEVQEKKDSEWFFKLSQSVFTIIIYCISKIVTLS